MRFFFKHFAFYICLAAAALLTLLDTFVVERELDSLGQILDGSPLDSEVFETPETSYTSLHSTPAETSEEESAADSQYSSAEAYQETESAAVSEPRPAGVFTDSSYIDENISISIETIRRYDTEIYIADVTISDMMYFKTAFANDTFGRNIIQYTSVTAARKNAIFAVNGDYYGFRPAGYVARNGVLHRSGGDGEALILKNDGSFEFFSEKNPPKLVNVLNVWSFGPALLAGGEIAITEDQEITAGLSWMQNPRTALGIISPKHYVFIVSDGRTDESKGLSLYNLAEIFQEKGCSDAYNLDGGGSATMVFNGRIVNKPTSDGKTIAERKISDIIYIGY